MDFRLGEEFSFDEGARFVARVVEEIQRVPLPTGTLLNVNAPAGDADRVEVCRLGKRIFRDELKLVEEEGSARRRYWMYGAVTGYHEEDGTDLAAIAAGHIAVTPLHFDLLDAGGMDELQRRDLARLLAPAAREVE
jgi:5'-nucleotidase